MENGEWAQFFYQTPTENVELVSTNPTQDNVTYETVENREPQMESLDDASWKARMEKKMDKCIHFMMIFEKFMEHFDCNAKKENPSEFILLLVLDFFISFLTMDSLFLGSTNSNEEDMSEFNGMKPASNEEELKTLEKLLEKPEFRDKLMRYMNRIWKLNGKKTGSVIFKDVVRQLLDPCALKDYSWKGQKRPNCGQMKSFKVTFPNFIDFVDKVVRLGDLDSVQEEIHDAFSKFLRQKNTEANRNSKRIGERRATSVRRQKKPRLPASEHNNETTENAVETTSQPVVDTTAGNGNSTSAQAVIETDTTAGNGNVAL